MLYDLTKFWDLVKDCRAMMLCAARYGSRELLNSGDSKTELATPLTCLNALDYGVLQLQDEELAEFWKDYEAKSARYPRYVTPLTETCKQLVQNLAGRHAGALVRVLAAISDHAEEHERSRALDAQALEPIVIR